MLPVAAPSQEPRTLAGRWTLTRRLSVGVAASTWLAVDADGAEAVVKWLSEPPGDELRALSTLVHPSIPALLGAGSHPMAYVVMERAPGRPGEEVLALGSADSLLVARVLASVASALSLVHARGWVHGDLSPANVMIGEERVCLLDFGMVGSSEGGTPDYMAPERFEGQGGSSSDVYGLGLVCWSLLEGEPPPAPGERLRAPPPRAVYGPAWMAELLEQMLAPDPAARPSAQDVVDECVARGVEPAAPERVALQRRGRSLLVERPVHRRLRRWFAHRDQLAVLGRPGHGIAHTARWAMDELLAAGARVVDVRAGGVPLAPLQALASDPRLPGPAFTLDPNAPAGLVFDTVDRILERFDGSLTLVVRGEGLADVCVDVLRELARSPQVAMLWVGRDAPVWLPQRVALSSWSDAELRELAAQFLGVAEAPPALDAFLARAAGVPSQLVAPLVEAVTTGAITRSETAWEIDPQRLADVWDDVLAAPLPSLSDVAFDLAAAVAAWGRALPVERALRWTDHAALPVHAWKAAVQELVHAGLVRVEGTTLTSLGARCGEALREHPKAALLRVHAYTWGDADGVDAAHWLELATAARVSAVLGRRGPTVLQSLARSDPERAGAWAEQVWDACSPMDRGGDLGVARVRALVAAGQLAAGAKALADVPLEARDRAAAALALGHLERGDVDAARRVVDDAEDAAATRLVRVELSGAARQLDEASEWLDKVDVAQLDEALAHRRTLLQAKLLRVRGDGDAALAVLEASSQRDGRWHNELASAFLTAGLARDAAAHFSAAARMPGWSVVDRANLTNQAGVASSLAGDLVPAIEAFTAAGSLFARLGQAAFHARCQANLAEAARQLGRFAVARRAALKALEIAGTGGEPAFRAALLSNLLAIDLDEGNVDAAAVRSREAQALHERASLDWDAELAGRHLRLGFAQGRAGLLSEVRRVIRQASRAEEHGVASELHLLECRILRRDDELTMERLQEHIAAATEPLVAGGRGHELAQVRVGFAELLLEIGAPDRAASMASQARTWAHEFQRRPLVARADRVLSRAEERSQHAVNLSQHMSRLVQLSVELLAVDDPAEVFEAVASAAVELTGADRAFVVRVSDDHTVGPSPRHAAAGVAEDPTDELTDETTGESLPRPVVVASAGALAGERPSWTVIRRCVAAGREVLVRNLAERDDLNRARSVRRMRLQAALAVPIDGGDELYGAIYVDRADGSFEAVRGSAGALRALARFSAVAVHNAYKAAALRQRAERADEVLHDVRNLLQPFLDFGDGVQGVSVADLHGPAQTVVRIAQRYAGAAAPEGRPVDLARVLGVWARAYAPLGADRHVRLELEIDADAVVVLCDATELQRAVGNLIGNGIKYATRGGEVALSLTVTSEEPAGRAWAQLDVHDDGPGVPKGHEERIFDREVQAVGARSGLGLGLTIARRVAREHGGDLVLLPSEQGARFRLTLPLLEAEAAERGRR